MKYTPLVSVVLPTYNRAEYLERSIRSVLSQTYQNWELIISDDGSTDDTTRIVTSFNDPRIKYFNHSNHGVAYTRNRAIEKSTGCYLAFIDSDDEWRKDKLGIQVGMMNDHPNIDLLFCDFLNIKGNRGSSAFEQNAAAMNLLVEEKYSDTLYVIKSGLHEGLAKDNFIATDSVILRRGILDRFGLFNEELRVSEDFELWWRLGLENVCFAYIDQPLITRYKGEESLSGHNKVAYDNRIRALDLCAEEAHSSGHQELILLLRPQYRNTWQNLIGFHGGRRNTREMVTAFVQSLKYGLRLGSMRLLLEGFFLRK